MLQLPILTCSQVLPPYGWGPGTFFHIKKKTDLGSSLFKKCLKSSTSLHYMLPDQQRRDQPTFTFTLSSNIHSPIHSSNTYILPINMFKCDIGSEYFSEMKWPDDIRLDQHHRPDLSLGASMLDQLDCTFHICSRYFFTLWDLSTQQYSIHCINSVHGTYKWYYILLWIHSSIISVLVLILSPSVVRFVTLMSECTISRQHANTTQKLLLLLVAEFSRSVHPNQVSTLAR